METTLQETLTGLAKKYGLTAIYVFGSQALEAASYIRGPSLSPINPEVDVDIGIQPAPGRQLTVQELVEIALTLEDLFKVLRVDLVVLSQTPPFLALDIIKGELIYCDEPDRQAEDELYILRRAGDLAYYEQQRRHLIIEGEPA